MTVPDASSITAHLKELRKRLIISLVAAGAGFLISYALSEYIYVLLARPLMPALPEGSEFLAFTGVVEPFIVYLKVGFLGGAVLASPVILYEVWAFVAPGLYDKEKRRFALLVTCSVALFLAGVLFAYLVVFPFGFKYLISYASPELKPIISMNSYFSLVTRLLLAFGIVYQLPLAMLVVARLGVVKAKQMRSWWRYAVILIVAASAIITPTPDVFNQLLMAGPLLVLYVVGLVVASVFGKKEDVEEEVEATVEPEEREEGEGAGDGGVDGEEDGDE